MLEPGTRPVCGPATGGVSNVQVKKFEQRNGSGIYPVMIDNWHSPLKVIVSTYPWGSVGL